MIYKGKTIISTMLTIVFLFLVFNLTAKVANYNLRNFELPAYQKLKSQISTANNYNYSDTENTKETTDYFLSLYSNTNYFETNGGMELTLDYSMFFTYEYRKDDEISNISKDYINERYFKLTVDNKKYIFDNYFVYSEFNGEHSFSETERDIEGTSDIDLDMRRETNSLKGLLGIGVGKIERTTNAYKTILLLKELESANKLTKDISQSEIEELAKKITVILKKRYYDWRIKKKTVLKEIDQLLKDMEFLDNTDIVSATILNDVLLEVDYSTRYSGAEAILAGMGGYKTVLPDDVSDISFSNYAKIDQNFFGIKGIANYYLPINLKTDFIFENIARISFYNPEDSDIDDFDFTKIKSSAGLNYYLNTRTTIETSFLYSYEKIELPDDESIDKNEFSFEITSTYYLNNRLKVYPQLSARYYKEEEEKFKDFEVGFHLDYSLF